MVSIGGQNVRSWFCIVYEAAKLQVDYANQDLTVLVPIIVDPLTCMQMTPVPSIVGVVIPVAMVMGTKFK